MNIRQAEISEIENFPLFDSENDGENVIVVEHDGAIVGYAQYNNGYDDAIIYFMESNMKGVGRAIIEWFQANYEMVTAHNAVETARPFYAHFGFDDVQSNGWAGQVDMTWYAEE